MGAPHNDSKPTAAAQAAHQVLWTWYLREFAEADRRAEQRVKDLKALTNHRL